MEKCRPKGPGKEVLPWSKALPARSSWSSPPTSRLFEEAIFIVKEETLTRSTAHQVTLTFLLPLGLGLIHAAVGLSAVNQVIAVTSDLNNLLWQSVRRRMTLSTAHQQRQE